MSTAFKRDLFSRVSDSHIRQWAIENAEWIVTRFLQQTKAEDWLIDYAYEVYEAKQAAWRENEFVRNWEERDQ